jgi:hypothetical protein
MSEEAIVLITILFFISATIIFATWLLCRSDEKSLELLKELLETYKAQEEAQKRATDLINKGE